MNVRTALVSCGEVQQGLVTTAVLRGEGISRSRLSRSVARGEVARVRPGVYAADRLGEWPVFLVTHEGVAAVFVQHVRAVLLSLGPGAAAGGRTAACLRGWGLLVEPPRTIEVVVAKDRGRARLAGVRAVRRRAPSLDVVVPLPRCTGLLVTSAVTTVVDCCTSLPLLDAVVLCDSALRSGQVTLAELERAAACLRGRRRAGRLRRALELCDPESGSVLESVLRVRMVEDGLEGLSTQVVVRDADGRYVRRVDFCFHRQRLVVETDGARWHSDISRDRAGDNRLAAAGWRVLRFSWAEVVHDPGAVLALVRAALTAGTALHPVVPSSALAA